MTTQYHLRPPVWAMHFHLYGRPLHPELFEVLAFRRIRHRAFTLDLRITAAGHVIGWRAGSAFLTETTAAEEELPAWGQLLNHPLQGERCALVGSDTDLSYQMSFQVESLTAAQFEAVHRETLEDASKAALMHTYATNRRWAVSPVSAIHAEVYGGCLSLAAFHTFPEECIVVKTQSLIEF